MVLFINSMFASPSVSYPLGLLSLCTILRAHNYGSEVIDFSNEIYKQKFDISDCNSYAIHIFSYHPSIVSFYTMANTFHISIEVARCLKALNSNVTIVFAGPQASVCAFDLLSAFSFIDLVAVGEGESNILTLVDIIKKGLSLALVQGIVYRDHDNSIYNNGEVELIQDLDMLPNIDYSLIPKIENRSFATIDVGRGCPFACTYCSTKTFWKQKYRLKSSDRILAEVESIISNYNIKTFSFTHDSFTANRKKIMDFCEYIILKGLVIRWACSARIDCLDPSLIDLMVRSGCYKIFLGIESGSSNIQKSINKNIDLEKAYECIQYISAKGIVTVCSFMFGFPTETTEDLQDTLNFINRIVDLGVSEIQLHPLTILRGTEMYEQYKNDLVFDETSFYYDFNGDSNAKLYVDIIKDHPELFPNFYKIGNSGFNSEGLDIFVNYFFKVFIKICRVSRKYIIHCFDENLYTFYKHIQCHMDDFMPMILDLFNRKKKASDISISILNRLYEFFMNFDIGEHTALVRCIFLYDYDFAHFSLLQNESRFRTYQYDVLEIAKKSIPNFNILPDETEICFLRSSENRKIIVQKITRSSCQVH